MQNEKSEIGIRNLKSQIRNFISPACASFDMFNNAKERGCKFKEIIEKL